MGGLIAPRLCARPGCTNIVVGAAQRRYCSPECRSAASRRRRRIPEAGSVPGICARPDCAKPFVGDSRRRYCTQTCANVAAYRRAQGLPADGSHLVRVCALPGCGKTFTATDDHQKWCSRECANVYWGRVRDGRPADGSFPKAICVRCGAEFEQRRSDAIYCSKLCQHNATSRRTYAAMSAEDRRLNFERSTAYSAAARIRAIGSGAEIDLSVTLGPLIERDQNTCWLCHEPCLSRDWERFNHPHYPTIDHRLPIIEGGAHTWDNVRLAHKGCNSEKHDDVCLSCGGPITELGEDICADCLAKGRGPKQAFAVCRHCGNVEMPGGWCSRCKAKGADIWAATGLTLKAAHALSRSLFPAPDIDEWIVGWPEAA